MESNEHFELFRMELQMENTNPFVYIGKVVLGVLCIFFTFLWWFQMYPLPLPRLFSELVLVNGRPVTYMVDTLLLYF